MLATRLSMTVSQLLRSISSQEITEWQALYEIEAAERSHAAKQNR